MAPIRHQSLQCKPPTRGPRGGATTISCLRCICPSICPTLANQALLAGLSSSLPIGQGCCCVGLPLRAIHIQTLRYPAPLFFPPLLLYISLSPFFPVVSFFSLYPSFPPYPPSKAGSQRLPVDVHHTARLSTLLAQWWSTMATSTSPKRRSG